MIRLRAARAEHRAGLPVAPLIGTDVAAAYRVQRAGIDERIEGGSHLIGYRIGLTSWTAQQRHGTAEPVYGRLLDDTLVTDGAVVPGRLIAPRAVGHIAFRIAETIRGDATPERVRAAIGGVGVAVELVDSRIASDQRLTAVDLIADNAGAGVFALGGDWRRLRDVEPWAVQVDVEVDGVVVGRPDDDVLRDPVHALTWLARRCASGRHPIAEGQVILTGAVAAAVPVAEGATIRVSADEVGEVTLRRDL